MKEQKHVDNHANILLLFITKKYTRNPEESSCNPEAPIGLGRGQLVAHRTASEQEILQPRDLSKLYNPTLQFDSTTQPCNSTLTSQLNSTTQLLRAL